MTRLLCLFPLPILLACAPGEAAWAIQAGAVTPDATGLTGVQAWSFFAKNWGDASGDRAFVCARAQTLTGTTAAPLAGCDACTVAYSLTVAEVGTDCDEDLAQDASYTLPTAIAIGPVDPSLADADPYPGRSLGWYASFDGQSLQAYGWAWDAALDAGIDPGPPGWNADQTYTLAPAFAWELAGATGGG